MDGDRAPQTVMRSKQFCETGRARGFLRGYTLPSHLRLVLAEGGGYNARAWFHTWNGRRLR